MITRLSAALTLAVAVGGGQGAMAAELSLQSGLSAQHSVEVIGDVFMAGGAVVSAFAALPLLLGEQAGQVSGTAADVLLDGNVAEADQGALRVSDPVVTTLPGPGAALRGSGKRQD